MKKLLTLILLSISNIALGQTIATQVNGWNALVTLPNDYNNTNIKYPTLIFFPGLGEVGTDINRLRTNGVHAYISQGGSIDGFIIISLQPANAYPNEVQINNRLNLLKSIYKIDAQRLNLTGLSHGGWCAATYVSGGFADSVKSVITVQGVTPNDNQPYPQSFAPYKGKYLCFEQIQDARGGDLLVNYINSLHPNNAQFIQTNISGGGHCCWNSFYGGQGVQPTLFTIFGIRRNIYEWLTAINALSTTSLNTNQPIPANIITDFSFDNNYIRVKVSKVTQWQLMNNIGQMVKYGLLWVGKNNIDISRLISGVYYFKTEFNNNRKLIKQ